MAPVLALLGTVTRVNTPDPLVALTFDDGPDPDSTPCLLEILERHGARATFFMLGDAAAKYPALVKRVAQAGHAIGNHSWDHPSFPLVGGRERRQQIRRCAAALAPYGERFFRAPYSDLNLAGRLDLFFLGYRIVMFDVYTHDWCGGDARTIADQLEQRTRPGSIIVLHDRLADALETRYFERTPMLEALDTFLERTKCRFRFVTVPALLRHGRAERELWFRKPKLDILNQLWTREGPGRRYRQPSAVSSDKHLWAPLLRRLRRYHYTAPTQLK
jgi:peptidoglycan/xylan/chitin deacetylase (PgdA/CDA1 family)